MNTMIDITYREFYDIPRTIYFTFGEHNYFLECLFDDKKDDYSDYYTIYEMPDLSPEELNGSWENLPNRACSEIGKIKTNEIEFDQTLRKSINSKIMEIIK
jgi:hypothetical protein